MSARQQIAGAALLSLAIMSLALQSFAAPDAESKKAGDEAMAIAKEFANGIVKLKDKYPNRLKDFSTEKHLRRIGVNAGFAPGTPNNPELASISFYNGIVGREPAPKVTDKTRGKKRQAPPEIFDKDTGVRIYVAFFKGEHRGNDTRPAEKLGAGDLKVHIYVKGPEGPEIRADLLKLLDKHRAK